MFVFVRKQLFELPAFPTIHPSLRPPSSCIGCVFLFCPPSPPTPCQLDVLNNTSVRCLRSWITGVLLCGVIGGGDLLECGVGRGDTCCSRAEIAQSLLRTFSLLRPISSRIARAGFVLSVEATLRLAANIVLIIQRACQCLCVFFRGYYSSS